MSGGLELESGECFRQTAAYAPAGDGYRALLEGFATASTNSVHQEMVKISIYGYTLTDSGYPLRSIRTVVFPPVGSL